MKLGLIEKNVVVAPCNTHKGSISIKGSLNNGKTLNGVFVPFEEYNIKYVVLFAKRYVLDDNLNLRQWKVERDIFGTYDYCY